MNNGGQVPGGETAPRRGGSAKARRSGCRPRKNNAHKNNVPKNNAHKNNAPPHVVPKPNGESDEKVVQESNTAGGETVVGESPTDETVAGETAERTKGLLLATLRVWELKHRISE